MLQFRKITDKSGFTLFELMLVSVIVAIVFGYFYRFLGGASNRQVATQTQWQLANFIEKAKTQSSRGVPWACIKLSNSSTLELWLDTNANHETQADACGDSGDQLIQSLQFPNDVSIPNCANNFKMGCPLFFHNGLPHICAVSKSTACGPAPTLTGANCQPHQVEFIWQSSSMDNDLGAKEIEIHYSGYVDNVPLGSKGFIQSSWAKHPGLAGSGACPQ